MMKNFRILVAFTVLASSLSIPAAMADGPMPFFGIDKDSLIKQGVPGDALETALSAYEWAIKLNKVSNKEVLTVVDYGLPDSSKRMWVINLPESKVIYNVRVAHGKGSGKGKMAKNFGDVNNSHKSVLGALLATNTYTGKHGKSLRLQGLENINKNTAQRNIVVHPATYASNDYYLKNKKLGHSWGCYAIPPKISQDIIDQIKGGSLVVSYAPNFRDINYS